jgi:hypothetical protein
VTTDSLDGYAVAVPFRLWGPWTLDADAVADFGCHEAGGSIVRHGDHYGLHVTGLATEETARRMIRVLRTALLWASVKLDVGIVTSYDDDEPALTWPTALQPQATVPAGIFPTTGRRLFVTAGRPVPQNPAVDPGAFRAAIIELTDALHKPVAREGFEIAAELYCGVDFEPSEGGRLLRLWTILECLAERTRRPAAIQEAVDRWQHEVDQLAAAGSLDSTESGRIKAFLDNARTQSINATVTDLIDRYAADSRAAMVSARSVRNSLVHGNAVRKDLGHAVYDLRSITRRVIAGVINDWIGAHPAPTRATEPS